MRRAVFLDRDGTLIGNRHYGCDPDAIELLEGVPEGLGLLKREGYLLIVVTNQSGVARGFFTEEQLSAMHRRLGELLEERGAGIDGWYYCPHHPEGVVPQYALSCECRKPRSGMVLRACADFDIDPTASWLIGDILDDVEAGKRVGTGAILLDLGTEGEPDRLERTPDYVALDFLGAVRYLLANDRGNAGQRPVPRRPRATGPGVGRGFIPRRTGAMFGAAGDEPLPYVWCGPEGDSHRRHGRGGNDHRG